VIRVVTNPDRAAAKPQPYDPRRRGYFRRVMAERRAAVRDIEIPKAKHARQRAACRSSLLAFINRYGRHRFTLGMSPEHKRDIRQIQKTILRGGLKAMGAPRGDGKTTRIEWGALWAALYGHRRFLVIFAGAGGLAAHILGNIKREIEDNDLLADDFPEVCAPIRALEGQPIRAVGQTVDGQRTQCCISGPTLILPTVKGSAASGVIIQARGIQAKVLGLKVRGRRPDFLLIDDPQDEELARNPKRVEERETLITGTLLGLAGPGERISAFATVTVRRKDDLAARFLSRDRHPEWHGDKRGMVIAWPDKRVHTEMWLGEYARLRREGLANDDDGKAATAYYRANRDDMDLGAVTSWPARYEPGELSAIQNAYNLLIDRGEAVFFSEYQNEPVESYKQELSITLEVICERLYGMPQYAVPPDCHWLVCAADINYSGLHWTAAGWRSDLAGFVCAHGNYTGGAPVLIDRDRDSGEDVDLTVYKAIDALAGQLAATQWRRGDEAWQLDCLAVDCGFCSNTVIKACKALDRRHGFRVLAVRGRGSKDFRPSRNVVGTPGDRLFLAEWPGKGYVVELDNDYHRMNAQRALLLPVGAPGSLALYGERAAEHKDYAQHICAERLIEFVHTDLRDYYTWDRPPGMANDWGDSLTYCRVVAQYCGASPLAVVQGPAPQQQQRRPRTEQTKFATKRRWW